MKEFGSLADFAAHLTRVSASLPAVQHAGLEAAASIIEMEAKAEIGTYQDEIGPFVAWAELADSTKADRVAQGYPDDEPLLRTGEMRDSIQHRSNATEAVVGSDSDIAVYQELGTEHIPPRSFLGGAAARKGDDAANAVGREVVANLVGGEVVGGQLRIR